jgi:predicted RNA-binding Zn-ribbon protein involved in translation (DUF1610 family)
MNIHTVLDKISGYLDALVEYAELTHDELDALCNVEDALYEYVKEKEGINMNIQKYFICKHCGKQLLNENLFAKCLANENEFHCDDCGKIYIIEKNDTVIEEDAE